MTLRARPRSDAAVTPPPAAGVDAPARWLGPLLAVLAMQTMVTVASRIAPTLAPAIAERIGWTVTGVGALVTAITVGSIVFLFAAFPVIRRLGSLRTLQAGLLCAAAGTLLYAAPTATAALAGSLLIGIGLGPAAAAGTEVLHRHAPARHRNLLFSVKQAGVPLGGMLAGLALPAMAQSWGLAAVAGTMALAALLVAGSMQPLRAGIDAGRDRSHPLGIAELLARRNLRRPVASLATSPALRRLGLASAGLALGQGAWFAFLLSYLVTAMGWSLTAAGALFALMQAVSAAGRPLAGWTADRSGSALRSLRGNCMASALTSFVLAASAPGWPGWAMATLGVVAGLTISSWNGVAIAPAARIAPPDQVGDTSAGLTLLVFGAQALTPVVFGLIALAGGGLRSGFAVAGLATLAAVVPLWRVSRS